MSTQKNPNTQKLGLSMKMRIVQKPTLLWCNENDDTNPGCKKCYELYPDGFFCPGKEKKVVKRRKLTLQEKKSLEDHLVF